MRGTLVAATLLGMVIEAASAAAAPHWRTASSLDALTALTAEPREALRTRLARTDIQYELAHDGWRVHHGDLTIDTDLDNDIKLVVGQFIYIRRHLRNGGNPDEMPF